MPMPGSRNIGEKQRGNLYLRLEKLRRKDVKVSCSRAMMHSEIASADGSALRESSSRVMRKVLRSERYSHVGVIMRRLEGFQSWSLSEKRADIH